MRFWICYQSNVSGPFGPQELARKFPQLGPETLVCPEDSSGEKVGDWKSAKDFQELAPYLQTSAVKTAEAAPARTSFSPPPKPPRFGALSAASMAPSAKHPIAPLVYELVNYMQATQQEVISKEEGAAGLLSRLSAQDEQVRQLSEAINQLRLAPDKNFEQYRREMAALEEKLGKEVGVLRESLRDLTDELDSRGEKARRQMAEAFAQKTAEADEHIAQLKARVGDLQGLIKRADAHIGDTEQKLESFDARLQQTDQRIQEALKDSGREAEEKLQKLGQQLREFSESLRRLEQQAQSSEDAKDQHSGERLDLAQKQLELAMSLLKSAEEKSKKQEDELSGLKSYVEGALSAQRDNLAAEGAETARRAEEKSAEWSQAAQKTALIEERLARTESLEADFRALLADFLEVKKASLAPGELENRIHRELESKHSDLGTLNSELHAIAERLGALDRQTAELKSFTSGLSGSSERRLDALESQIPRVGEVFETLHKNREGLELALDQVKEILSLKSGVEESARKQASDSGELAKKVERLERAIEDFGRKFERLETEPAELRGPGGVRDAAAEAAPAPLMESEWQSAQKNLAEVERMLDEKLPSLEKRIGDWDAREKDLQARLESRLKDEILALERKLQPAAPPPQSSGDPVAPVARRPPPQSSGDPVAPVARRSPPPPEIPAPLLEAAVAKPPLEQLPYAAAAVPAPAPLTKSAALKIALPPSPPKPPEPPEIRTSEIEIPAQLRRKPALTGPLLIVSFLALFVGYEIYNFKDEIKFYAALWLARDPREVVPVKPDAEQTLDEEAEEPMSLEAIQFAKDHRLDLKRGTLAQWLEKNVPPPSDPSESDPWSAVKLEKSDWHIVQYSGGDSPYVFEVNLNEKILKGANTIANELLKSGAGAAATAQPVRKPAGGGNRDARKVKPADLKALPLPPAPPPPRPLSRETVRPVSPAEKKTAPAPDLAPPIAGEED